MKSFRQYCKENVSIEDADGKIYAGAKAFIILWDKMPKFKLLGKILSLPIIYHIFSFTYEIVAFFLYIKNKSQLKN